MDVPLEFTQDESGSASFGISQRVAGHVGSGQLFGIRGAAQWTPGRNPRDRADLIAAVGRSSAQSLYRRFFAVKRDFAEPEIEFFLNVDFVNHVALVAVVDESGRPVIAGGGRYIVVEPGKAEVAFAVVDQYPFPHSLCMPGLSKRSLFGAHMELYQAGIYSRECDVLHTSFFKPGDNNNNQEGKAMALKPEPHRLAFVLMVLAMVATTLMITAWAAHDWATAIPPTETVYRPQHSNVY
jgi:hypothetical protein